MILIEILPNLYLGDLESVKYKGQIETSHTINCVKDLKTIGNNSEYVFSIKKNIEQYEIVKMYQYLIETSNFIYKHTKNDNSVLVYCENGNQKAATVIAAYLIKYGKMSADESIKTIRTKNKTAFYPNIDYYSVLQLLEKD